MAESTFFCRLFMCKVCAFLSLFDLCICICCHLYIVGTTLSPVGDDAAKPHFVDAGRPWRDRYQMRTENAQETRPRSPWHVGPLWDLTIGP